MAGYILPQNSPLLCLQWLLSRVLLLLLLCSLQILHIILSVEVSEPNNLVLFLIFEMIYSNLDLIKLKLLLRFLGWGFWETFADMGCWFSYLNSLISEGNAREFVDLVFNFTCYLNIIKMDYVINALPQKLVCWCFCNLLEKCIRFVPEEYRMLCLASLCGHGTSFRVVSLGDLSSAISNWSQNIMWLHS